MLAISLSLVASLRCPSGQKAASVSVTAMSALPSKADVMDIKSNVWEVPWH